VNQKGSRFADGSFGGCYAADQLETAIDETAHHFAGFAHDACDPPRREAMRLPVGAIPNSLHDAGTLLASQRDAVYGNDFRRN
jgi:RES domain-containing protein